MSRFQLLLILYLCLLGSVASASCMGPTVKVDTSLFSIKHYDSPDEGNGTWVQIRMPNFFSERELNEVILQRSDYGIYLPLQLQDYGEDRVVEFLMPKDLLPNLNIFVSYKGCPSHVGFIQLSEILG